MCSQNSLPFMLTLIPFLLIACCSFLIIFPTLGFLMFCPTPLLYYNPHQGSAMTSFPTLPGAMPYARHTKGTQILF